MVRKHKRGVAGRRTFKKEDLDLMEEIYNFSVRVCPFKRNISNLFVGKDGKIK